MRHHWPYMSDVEVSKGVKNIFSNFWAGGMTGPPKETERGREIISLIMATMLASLAQGLRSD